MSLDEKEQALETAQSAFTLASYLTGYLDAHGNDTLQQSLDLLIKAHGVIKRQQEQLDELERKAEKKR